LNLLTTPESRSAWCLVHRRSGLPQIGPAPPSATRGRRCPWRFARCRWRLWPASILRAAINSIRRRSCPLKTWSVTKRRRMS